MGASASGPNSPENKHERVRRQHANELAQDYLEAIYGLLGQGRAVTIRGLQDVFGVSHVTVIQAIKRLNEQGLVEGTRSREITLTPEGEEIGRRAAARHELLRRFFMALGVSPEQADADAEGAEHHLSEETLEAIEQFLQADRAGG